MNLLTFPAAILTDKGDDPEKKRGKKTLDFHTNSRFGHLLHPNYCFSYWILS